MRSFPTPCPPLTLSLRTSENGRLQGELKGGPTWGGSDLEDPRFPQRDGGDRCPARVLNMTGMDPQKGEQASCLVWQ